MSKVKNQKFSRNITAEVGRPSYLNLILNERINEFEQARANYRKHNPITMSQQMFYY